MILIADTNILARLATRDDDSQFEAACQLFDNAEKIVIPTIVFCELTWVLQSKKYRKTPAFIADTIRDFLNHQKTIAADDEVLAGLQILGTGGDFADGVVQYAGCILAGKPATFASFDTDAVEQLLARGFLAMIPQNTKIQ